jgi:hypothetical protein
MRFRRDVERKTAQPRIGVHIPEWFCEEASIEAAALDTNGARSTPLTGGGDFVPQEKVSMRKVKEVLRLRFGLGLPQSQIARSCSLGQATVLRYLQKAAAAGLSWPLPEDVDDRHLEEFVGPGRTWASEPHGSILAGLWRSAPAVADA